MQHWACSSFPLTFFWSSSLQKPPSFISATQEYMQYFFTALFIKRLSSRGSWVSQIFWWCKWGSSLTSWRLWQFRPVESDFSGVSRLWRSTKHALNISGEYELWYCQYEKSALYIHKKKNSFAFFLDIFTLLLPSSIQTGTRGVCDCVLLLLWSHPWRRNPPRAVKNKTPSLVQKDPEMQICGC